MKRKILYTFIGLGAILATSCVDMDRTPENIWTDDDLLSNDAGVEVYMARLYSQMPWEDFKYMAQWGFNRSSWLGALGIEGTGEALNRDGITTSFTNEDTAWWGNAFTLIREANHMIETLPDYAENFDEARLNDYIGQAYFVRAYSFYQMARRFGGIPLTLQEAQYPAESDALEIPRSTEEETWNQILADFDMAAELMQPTSLHRGYANKYVALAFKAEAMNYAGCVAKYNETVNGTMTGFGSKTGVRVMGFDPSTSKEASAKYFAEAYKAARQVMNEGGYSLRQASSSDPQALYQNMVDMWRDLSSPENMLVREYSYPTFTHGLDAYSSPYLWHHPLSGGTCPTLDFIELYDWPETFGEDHGNLSRRYSDGKLRVTDGNSCSDGNYLMFDSAYDFFADAEPRLRAYVIFPGDTFRNTEIEVRAGVYTGDTSNGLSPFFGSDYSYASADNGYQNLDIYTSTTNKTLYMTGNPAQPEMVTLSDGSRIESSGANGPFYNYAEATLTGLHLRKYLDPDLTEDEIGEGMSDQPFILMRYADVLLAAAEAAVELSIAGEPCPVEGDDMLQVATEAIQQIQRRAGANVLDHKLTGTNEDRDIVRKERRKELAFEHKTKWDLRRWRVLDKDNRDGFWCDGHTTGASFSNDIRFRFRGLYPFMTADGKWFFDSHYNNFSSKEFSYNTVDYYFAIPSGEVTKSPVIDQQPSRY